jgi:hypothetical protein
MAGKPSVNSPSPPREWQDFMDAITSIMEEIGVTDSKAKIDKHETPGVGYLYQATFSEGGYHIYFAVDGEGSSDKIFDWRELSYSIDIAHPDGTKDNAHNRFSKRSNVPDPAMWVVMAFHSFNVKARKVDLDSLFEDTEIRVLGFPGMNHYTLLTSLLTGASIEDSFPPTVMRFRHITRQGAEIGVRFSYVLHVSHTWVVFPDIAGLSGGASRGAYVSIEKTISDLVSDNIEVFHYDYDYSAFMRYVARHANFLGNSWDLIDKREELIDFYLSVMVAPAPGEAEPRFKAEIEKINDKIWNDQYPEALRDQRALLQDALQELLKRRKLDFSDGSKISHLAGILIEHRILEPRLKSWFDAYPAFANSSAHRIYPTKEELEDEVVRSRVRVTISIGKHLLYEVLGAILATDSQSSNPTPIRVKGFTNEDEPATP